MLTIRLQRVGKKKFATYRLIVLEKSRDPWGKHLEQVGTYNPHDKVAGLVVKADRIKHWIDNGAMPSETVHNLLLKNKLIEGKPAKSVFISKKRQVKLAEKKKTAPAA